MAYQSINGVQPPLKNTQFVYYFWATDTSNTPVPNSPKIGANFVVHKISQNGNPFVDTVNTVVEVGQGWYSITLTSSEMNADVILLRFSASGTCTESAIIYTTSGGSGGSGASAADIWNYLLTSGFESGSIGAYIYSTLELLTVGGSSPTLEQIQQVVREAVLIFGKN
jgi:hypothetical protein